jgi:hypothetical protein
MSKFTIYNPTTKEIGEELEFDDYIKANEFVNAHYPEGYIAKVNPFHFTSDFYSMLKEGHHGAFKYDKNQKCIAITHGYKIYHCNYLSLQDFVSLKDVQRTGLKINVIELSKKDFINLHNSLIDNPTLFHENTGGISNEFLFTHKKKFEKTIIFEDKVNKKLDIFSELQKIRNDLKYALDNKDNNLIGFGINDIDTLLYKIKNND